MNPANARSAQTKELPHSDIRTTAAKVVNVSEVDSSAWSHGGEYVVHPAIMIEFTNHATQGGPETEPTVAASLTYKDSKRELLQIEGGWADSPTALVQFKIHETHKLLIGLIEDGQFVAVEHAHATAEGSRERQTQKHHPLPGFIHGLVCVTLTDVRNQRLLYDSYFEIGVNPLRISQNIAP